MTDIWDEKPNPMDKKYWEETSYGDVTLDIFTGKYFDDEAVWLEKVKELYDIYVKQYRNMTEHALEQQKVLETVKGYVIMEAENIKSDMDHKGMLKPALEHFLKE